VGGLVDADFGGLPPKTAAEWQYPRPQTENIKRVESWSPFSLFPIIAATISIWKRKKGKKSAKRKARGAKMKSFPGNWELVAA